MSTTTTVAVCETIVVAIPRTVTDVTSLPEPKFVPNTEMRLPPARGPLLGTTEVMTGPATTVQRHSIRSTVSAPSMYANRFTPRDSPRVVDVTTTSPEAAAVATRVRTTTVVGVCDTMSAAVPASTTLVMSPAPRPEPVIVTSWPPTTDADFGCTLATVPTAMSETRVHRRQHTRLLDEDALGAGAQSGRRIADQGGVTAAPRLSRHRTPVGKHKAVGP